MVSDIYELTLFTRLTDLGEEIDATVEVLAAALAAAHKIDGVTESAKMVRDVLLPRWRLCASPATRRSSVPPSAAGRSPPTVICCSACSKRRFSLSFRSHRVPPDPVVPVPLQTGYHFSPEK